MPTKLTGIGATGLPETAGDTGTLVTDGSLILGNADTDNITVNAEFNSHLIPDEAGVYDLGSTEKCWNDLHVENRIYRHGPTFGTTLDFVDPSQDIQITFPGIDGTLALEGLLPSYMPFGNNNSQSAPLTNFELSTVNGSTNAQGWRMPVAGYVTNMSCQIDATSSGGGNNFLVTLWKNGVQQAGYQISLNNVVSGDAGGSVAFPTPLPFAANDRLTLKLSMSVSSGTFSMDDLACLLRILN